MPVIFCNLIYSEKYLCRMVTGMKKDWLLPKWVKFQFGALNHVLIVVVA